MNVTNWKSELVIAKITTTFVCAAYIKTKSYLCIKQFFFDFIHFQHRCRDNNSFIFLFSARFYLFIVEIKS